MDDDVINKNLKQVIVLLMKYTNDKSKVSTVQLLIDIVS
jgi:hypothetical protein